MLLSAKVKEKLSPVTVITNPPFLDPVAGLTPVTLMI